MIDKMEAVRKSPLLVRKVYQFVKMFGQLPMLGRLVEQNPNERDICANCPLRIGNVACLSETYVESPVHIDAPGIQGWFKSCYDVPTCKHPERSRTITRD